MNYYFLLFQGSGYARQEWKATLTVAIVVMTFLVCWLPFFVLALVRPLNPQTHIPGYSFQVNKLIQLRGGEATAPQTLSLN